MGSLLKDILPKAVVKGLYIKYPLISIKSLQLKIIVLLVLPSCTYKFFTSTGTTACVLALVNEPIIQLFILIFLAKVPNKSHHLWN